MKSSAGRIALITGGAGFIGANLAERLLANAEVHVRIYDNLSRPGVRLNLDYLKSLPGGSRVSVITGDVRDASSVKRAVENVSEIYHLAAQVAVTTSVTNPMDDFETNARGTLNILEAARQSRLRPFVLFTSTNKIYGSLLSVPLEATGDRYAASDRNFLGVDESFQLDFHSPYGCSKGAADQYVHDYARIYDLPTVVFRMSCIAGPRQFGNEDQGWVAHFLYSVLSGKPITIYGDGLQVRDVLHVYDLTDAMVAARDAVTTTSGHIYNLGGGMERTFSVIEMLRLVEQKTGLPLLLQSGEMRPGDQPLYISDTSKFRKHTGWSPRRSMDRILADIAAFWKDNHDALTGKDVTRQLVADLVAVEVR